MTTPNERSPSGRLGSSRTRKIHLATKPTFASIISAWCKEPEVQRAFCDHTLGREERWAELIDRVERTCVWRDMKLFAQAEARRKRKKS
jgi:hypothetical protein